MRRNRLWLAVEYLVLFYLPPLLCVTGVWLWHPMLLMVPIGVAAVAWHLRLSENRARLLRVPDAPHQISRIILLFALLGTALVLLLAIVFPAGQLFWLPRNRPAMWLSAISAYCLVSVVPQELFFRSFLFDRYAQLFRSHYGLLAASSIAYAYAHIVFGGWVAPLLSLAGGLIFSARYQKTGSVLLTSFEHALWGMLVLSVGLEREFLTDSASYIWK